MASANQHYCLRWNNYQSNMTSVFHHLLRTEAFVDVTLACNEQSLKAHKVVLSACSSYFQKLLIENPCKHPTIIMPQDVCFTDLKFIIEFVYRGEIDVSQTELQSLLKTADQLKIKGLCEVPEESRNSGDPMASATAEVQPLEPIHHPCTSTTGTPPSDQHHTSTSHHAHPHQHPLTHTQSVETETSAPSHHMGGKRGHSEHRTPHHQTKRKYTKHATTHNASSGTTHHQITLKNGQHCMTISDPSGGGGSDSHSLKTAGGNIVILTDPSANSHHTTLMIPSSTAHSLSSLQSHQVVIDGSEVDLDAAPAGPTATPVPVCTLEMTQHTQTTSRHRDIAVGPSLSIKGEMDEDGGGGGGGNSDPSAKVKFETLHQMEPSGGGTNGGNSEGSHQGHHSQSHLELSGAEDEEHTMHTMMITPELLGLLPSSSSNHSDGGVSDSEKTASSLVLNKNWTHEDMEAALEALRNGLMSLTKASVSYGIPSTTLWQRAHRLGIHTPKKEGPAKSWTEDILNVALDALRAGSISANKASKAYGIPSSTLYKIARKEGIRLAQPFNASPTTWNPEDLERALEAIRSGQTTVQRASAEYGIPSGTLYGRCKREGIELSRSNPTPWSEDAMVDALEAVRMGQMSINQAAIHFNLPYSSLYGRFKRVKYEADHPEGGGGDGSVIMDGHHPSPAPSNQSQSSVQSHHTTSQHGTPQPPQPPHTPQLQQQQQQQASQSQQSVVYKGDQALSEILNFIEGKTTCKDSKKAAKKARQKEKKLQEIYQRKLEEEAAERAKLEAEKRRKEELLREKERLIKEQQRLERELQKQSQKANMKENNVNNSNNNNNNKKTKYKFAKLQGKIIP
uniref:Protein bric-a-brac 1 n=1 Tax=Cacopsylla melanoneura TaxID=428564 RepID=A0A8D8XD73_9HEMI